MQQELIWELGQLDIGVGTLQATNSRMAEGVATPVESLWEWAQQRQHVHVDETPWPVMGLCGVAVGGGGQGFLPVSG